MILSFVVAQAQNRVIGRGNGLPWRLPDDLKFFKRVTVGKPVIMGRKTYETIGRPLPERTNIVVTRSPRYAAPGCIVVNSIEEALAAAEPAPEVMLIGGASLYTQTLVLADRIYLTLVQTDVEGDAWFPELDWREWREVSREEHASNAKHEYPFSFILLERVR